MSIWVGPWKPAMLRGQRLGSLPEEWRGEPEQGEGHPKLGTCAGQWLLGKLRRLRTTLNSTQGAWCLVRWPWATDCGEPRAKQKCRTPMFTEQEVPLKALNYKAFSFLWFSLSLNLWLLYLLFNVFLNFKKITLLAGISPIRLYTVQSQI